MLHCAIRIPFERVSSYSLTLTYHDVYSIEPAQWHDELHRWEGQLFWDWRHFGPSIEWFLEFQRRGAPHFHAIICWEREPVLEQFRRWLSSSWNAIVAPGDELHLKAGTRADRIDARSPKGIRNLTAYLAKHSGKSRQKRRVDPETLETLPTGRMWGVAGELPQLVVQELHLEAGELFALCRRLRRWGQQFHYLAEMGKRYRGGIVYGAAGEVGQLLRGLGRSPPDPA